MLRMTRSSPSGSVTLHLEGRLLAAWVDEVLSAIADTAGGRVRCLDLSGLTFVDEAGARLLTRLRLDGVAIEHVPPLIAGLIAQHAR